MQRRHRLALVCSLFGALVLASGTGCSKEAEEKAPGTASDAKPASTRPDATKAAASPPQDAPRKASKSEQAALAKLDEVPVGARRTAALAAVTAPGATLYSGDVQAILKTFVSNAASSELAVELGKAVESWYTANGCGPALEQMAKLAPGPKRQEHLVKHCPPTGPVLNAEIALRVPDPKLLLLAIPMAAEVAKSHGAGRVEAHEQALAAVLYDRYEPAVTYNSARWKVSAKEREAIVSLSKVNPGERRVTVAVALSADDATMYGPQLRETFAALAAAKALGTLRSAKTLAPWVRAYGCVSVESPENPKQGVERVKSIIAGCPSDGPIIDAATADKVVPEALMIGLVMQQYALEHGFVDNDLHKLALAAVLYDKVPDPKP